MIKRAEYQSSIAIFPDFEGEFDRFMAQQARALIISKFEESDRPKRIEIAKDLGMLRDRLSRLITSLGIERKVKDICAKKRKQEEKGGFENIVSKQIKKTFSELM